ncbi:MAG: glycosyltransferase family 2 protein [Candidatus Rokubacteria bacterium]|nr:glycosyltransferase family 2 protein [Candidatus Rokubacteria bacterium]
MTAAPFLSVCVPTYNRVSYLAQALATLRAQTYLDFELLVVDNGSTDGTAELVGSISDPRLRYHRNPTNLGSRGNWNRCLELARGEFVAICHDDDVYDPDFLRRGVEVLMAHPEVAFVHCAARVIDGDGGPLRIYRAHRRDTILPSATAFLRYLARSHDVVMSTVIARRRCYGEERFTEEFLCADFEMWLKLALRGDVAYIATPLVSYRSHAESTSLTMDARRWYRENAEIVRRAVAWARGRVPGLEGREAEFLRGIRRVWAGRTFREALFAASCGRLDTGTAYLAACREIADGGAWQAAAALAGLLLNPFGVRLLRSVRLVRREVRRVV